MTLRFGLPGARNGALHGGRRVPAEHAGDEQRELRAGAVTGSAPAGRRLRRYAGALPRLTLLLLITAQLADLATFGLAVHALGIAGEVGPLRVLYRMGGFGAVALAKLVALGVMIAILELYSRRTGHGRWLAILAATMGVFGALTNVLALL